jgi:hypothetical protein
MEELKEGTQLVAFGISPEGSTEDQERLLWEALTAIRVKRVQVVEARSGDRRALLTMVSQDEAERTKAMGFKLANISLYPRDERQVGAAGRRLPNSQRRGAVPMVQPQMRPPGNVWSGGKGGPSQLNGGKGGKGQTNSVRAWQGQQDQGNVWGAWEAAPQTQHQGAKQAHQNQQAGLGSTNPGMDSKMDSMMQMMQQMMKKTSEEQQKLREEMQQLRVGLSEQICKEVKEQLAEVVRQLVTQEVK